MTPLVSFAERRVIIMIVIMAVLGGKDIVGMVKDSKAAEQRLKESH